MELRQQTACSQELCHDSTCGIACECKCHDHTDTYLRSHGGFTAFTQQIAAKLPDDLPSTIIPWDGKQLLDTIHIYGRSDDFTPSPDAYLGAQRLAVSFGGLSDAAARPDLLTVGLDGLGGIYVSFHKNSAHVIVICREDGSVNVAAIAEYKRVRLWHVRRRWDTWVGVLNDLHEYLKGA